MPLSQIKKVTIIGVGFMGGSLSLALKKKFPKVKVWGFARSRKSYRKLKKLKILDKVEMSLKEAVNNADLVVLALPVEAIIDCLKILPPLLKKGAIVFDLGSSKEKIEKTAAKYFNSKISFVGCHPLAGSEKSTAQFIFAFLYQGSLCFITSPQTKSSRTIKRLWESLGCRVIFLDSVSHDRILSSLSHLPHLLSFSLADFVPREYLKFATSSFKELTRIANSPASVWADIFLSNRKNILRDLKKYLKVLKQYQASLERSDKNSIVRLIDKANDQQKQLA